MLIVTNKCEAGARQLDAAIELLFAGADPLAIRTLTSAAFTVFADLVTAKTSVESWKALLIADSGLPPKDAVRVINGAANFLKHAEEDPDGVLQFEEAETDHLIFFATLDCARVAGKLSSSMQAFQVWYLACHGGAPHTFAYGVRERFPQVPDLSGLDRFDQIQKGADFLAATYQRFGRG